MARVRLTPRQMAALQFLREFWDREGYGPSLQELGDGLGVGTSAAGELLAGLVAAGAVEDLGPPRAHRRWAPTEDAAEPASTPGESSGA